MGVLKFYELYKPQPKQLEAFKCIGKYARILYGGARGGAKTSFSVYAAVAASLQYPGLRTTIVRKTNKDLKKQIILGELLKHFSPKKMEGTYKYYSTDKRAAFSNGSHIFFTSIQHDSDVEKEQGIESGLYILDEGNKLAWETIQKLSASNRSTGDIVNSRGQRWKDTTIITANPGGVCDNEIKYRWITPDYSRWTEEELKMKDEYVFIKANVYDNKHLDSSYLAKLKSLSEMLRRQWLDGDWDANSGAFFEEWAEKIHVVETLPNGQVTPPSDWFKWRAMDLGGGTHPSVCLWLRQEPELYVSIVNSRQKVSQRVWRKAYDIYPETRRIILVLVTRQCFMQGMRRSLTSLLQQFLSKKAFGLGRRTTNVSSDGEISNSGCTGTWKQTAS